MKETERKKINENLKSIINEAVNVLPTGEMLALINLSARAELHFKKNNKSNSEAIIDINNMIVRIFISLKSLVTFSGFAFGRVSDRTAEVAQNCQPSLNLNISTKLLVCTSPRLKQNPF